MFQYADRRMGGLSRRRRRRRLATLSNGVDPAVLGALVPVADPPAVFTPAEDAEVAEGHSSQRSIELDYHRSLSRRLRRLARRAPALERRKVHQLHVAAQATGAEQRLRGAERANRGMRDHGRHLARWVRVAIVLVLAAVDVVAYRAAVEIAFDTSDEWPAIIDSYLLSLLSIGMVMAAMFAAEQLKALHTTSDERVADPGSILDQRRHARRVWFQAGLPALIGALALLVAGAALRVNALGTVPGWFWLAVPAFSGSALVGAFCVEYKWADKSLDERDDLARKSRWAHGRLRRADRRLARVEGGYRMRQATIEQLWSLFEPGWRVQMEMAAARVASARADHPELFHPLGRSVVESVHERIARGTTRRDAAGALDHLGLAVDQVLDRARLTHASRRPGSDERSVGVGLAAPPTVPVAAPATILPPSPNGQHPDVERVP